MSIPKKSKKIAIIGAGISGLSAAAYLAKQGFEVDIYEKNSIAGGRARQFSTQNGYTFDMGPSWYWMPDIIENFFQDFGTSTSDFYELVNLNPQFEMVFENNTLSVPSNYDDLKNLFEIIEVGAAKKLEDFMRSAKYKYEVGMQEFVQKPCLSIFEFASLKVLKSALQLDLLSDYRSYVSKYFKHPQLKALMEFPVIFLGAAPKNIPALYSLMNYGGYALGTWYPKGGFFELIKAMVKINENLGVKLHINSSIDEILINDNRVKGVKVNGVEIKCDQIICSSDYHHSEKLIPSEFRNYSNEYWDKKTFAPSCLIFYLGINEEIPNLKHHTLFFEPELDQHIDEIYESKKWPNDPLFYVCNTSKTDENVAPKGHENLFLLMPLAINIEDNEEMREKYLEVMLKRLEKQTGVEDLVSKIDFKKSYCINDFKADYNAYGGNAYGLANTLNQTAVLKPSIRNKKLPNLYYTGQLTVPGPGVPPSLISGKIVAKELIKNLS
jgi:phytoene desaturase